MTQADGMTTSFHNWQSASDAFVLQLEALRRHVPGASAELCRLRQVMQQCQSETSPAALSPSSFGGRLG